MSINYHDWKAQFNKLRPSLDERMAYVKHVIDHETHLAPTVQYDWLNIYARDEQVPYYYSNDWTTYAYIGGRGVGKSKTANEWAKYLVFDKHKDQAIRIGIICPTQSDIERVMVMGDSGIFSVMTPHQLGQAKYNINGAKVTFDNGSIIYYYSAENAERLRGNQWHYCALDELAAYSQEKIPDILMQVTMCLRLKPPSYIMDGVVTEGKCQKMITTTPKPQPWLRKLFRDAMHDDQIIIARGSTYDNQANLDATMFKDIVKYEGTAIGRQEVHGEILLDNDEGIIKREWIQLWNCDEKLPRLKYVFGSYDLAATEKKENDPCAMVMFGVFEDRDKEYSLITLDHYSEWLEYPDLRAQMLIDWNKRYGDQPTNRKKAHAIIVENKSNGQAIISDIGRLGVKIIKYTPGRGDDKHSRMNAISHLIKDGRLYFPESKVNRGTVHTAYKDFYNQLCDFPLVEHDDLADCVSQALIIFSKGQILVGDVTERDYDAFSGFEEEDSVSSEKTKNPYIC